MSQFCPSPVSPAGWAEILGGHPSVFESLWQEFPDHIFLVSCTAEGDFILEDCNPALQAYTGLPADKTRHRPVRELVAGPYRETVLERYRQCVVSGRPYTYEETGTVADSDAVHHWMTLLVPAHGPDGQVSFLLGISRDVTALRQAQEVLRRENELLEQRVALRTAELEAANAQLRQMAMYDSLTGVYSRGMFFELAAEAIGLARQECMPLSALMLDIDFFKKINDTWGHAAGDQVLRQVGHRLREQLRGSDIIGRCGGEEFAVILPRQQADRACAVAQQLCDAMCTRLFPWEGQQIACSISIGVAELSREDESIEKLLHRADLALLQAKGDGRNCYRLASGSDLVAL